MKVYNENIIQMSDELFPILEEYRRERNFDPEEYLQEKVELIAKYLQQSNLTGVALGVSGGVDSAVVLAILKRVQDTYPNILLKITPMLLPALGDGGVTNQSETVERGVELCEALDLTPVIFTKLSQLTTIVTDELNTILGMNESEWARGQLVAYLRTPILYNTCSILTNAGIPTLVAGTTNLSEGGYIGYVGKASDGVTDLQIISDLFKSEVYLLAKFLQVPESILGVTPNGDMFDGRVDEEVFGTTYDFLELYMHALMANEVEKYRNLGNFTECAERIEKLHNYNKHKYNYSMPSVFMDIMEAKTPNGWDNEPWGGVK